MWITALLGVDNFWYCNGAWQWCWGMCVYFVGNFIVMGIVFLQPFCSRKINENTYFFAQKLSRSFPHSIHILFHNLIILADVSLSLLQLILPYPFSEC